MTDDDDCPAVNNNVTAMMPTRRHEARRDQEARRIADLCARLAQLEVQIVDQKQLARQLKYGRIELGNLLNAYSRYLR
jgi:hypothetical protein